jgi:sodium ion-translocating decarboxylase beta subunit
MILAAIGDLLENFVEQMAWFQNGDLDSNFLLRVIMICVALLLIFLAIKKGFEPYLLIPIGVGMLLVNLDPSLYHTEIVTMLINGKETSVTQGSGLLYQIHQGISLEIFPPLIFLGIGATTDFGPLIANPKSLILGAAAQLGIFITFLGAIVLGYSGIAAASIGIIGGADGPTAIFLSNKLLAGVEGGEKLCAIIAVIAYSYMALVPVIQPPVIKLLTTKKERRIHMDDIREVSKKEKILFPLVVMVITILLIPSCSALIGMLMLGNLIKESGVVPELVTAAAKTIMYTVTILLGLSVGATATITVANAKDFLFILILGMFAFSFATAGGVLVGKIMCKLSHGKINPMIGAAGVSAVPMAARVVHKIGQEEDDSNYLLMAAMGPNVAGVIGSAVAAGLLLSIFG